MLFYQYARRVLASQYVFLTLCAPKKHSCAFRESSKSEQEGEGGEEKNSPDLISESDGHF